MDRFWKNPFGSPRAATIVSLVAAGAIHGLVLAAIDARASSTLSEELPTWLYGTWVAWAFTILFPAVAIAHEYRVPHMRLSACFLALTAAVVDIILLPMAPLTLGLALFFAALVLFRVALERPQIRSLATDTDLVQPLHRALIGVTTSTALLRDGYGLSLTTSGDILLTTLAVAVFVLGIRDELNLENRAPKEGLFFFVLRALALFAIPFWGITHSASLIVIPELMRVLLYAWRGRLGGYVRDEMFRNPPMLLIMSFGVVIALGTILLSLPISSANGTSIGFLSAFFTSTSATCVTGLSVLDTGTGFSTFGHCIILLLIQIGGLGIITISAFVVVLVGARIGVKNAWALSEITDQPGPQHMRQLVWFVVFSTAIIESLGLFFLFLGGLQEGMAWPDALWFALFHTISAFCNAGFSLYSNSLVGFADNGFIMWTVSILVILGGLGFIPMSVIYARMRRKRHRLGVHTQVALIGTLALLGLGTVLFWLLEGPVGAVDPNASAMSIKDSAFHSVSLRTAGFNAMPMEQLGPPSTLLSMLFMFVGGCPGGTAGGIKVTTMIVLLLSIRSLLRNETHVELIDRTLPQQTVVRALVVVLISVSMIFFGWLILLATQTGLSMEQLGFEAVSAYGTVGLSLDTTSHLDSSGQTIVALLMFAGRVGPLAMVFGIGSPRKVRARPAVEEVYVG